MRFDHFLIRPLVATDLVPYFNLVDRNRERLEDFFTGTVTRTASLNDTEEFLADITTRPKSKSYFPYVIIDEDNGEFAGFLDLKNLDWSIPKSEMGCYLDFEYAGKGVGKQAFSVFCEYCFRHFEFEKLFLRTHESNKAAQQLAVGAGFIKEGVLRKDYKTTSGKLVDLIYYGRLRGAVFEAT